MWIVLTTCLLSTAAAKPKDKSRGGKSGASKHGDVPFTVPDLPPPTDPGQAASPYEARLVVPDLSEKGEFDLRSLSYVITTFRINADLGGLTKVTADNEAWLIQHIAADPIWRLVEWGGALVAFRREKDGDAWTVPMRGYHASDSEVWRAALRFTDWGAGAPWRDSPVVSRADATDPTVDITAFRLEEPPLQAVAVSWSGPELSLEIFEAAHELNLVHTSREIPTLGGFLGLAAREDVATRGYSPSAMPRGWPATGEPSVELVPAHGGELDLRAKVHMPSRGITWARLLDTDLRPWEEAAVATGTREIVGWGGEAANLYYMQGRFPVPPGKKMSGTAEIWFQADGGKEPERIGAFPVTIPAR